MIVYEAAKDFLKDAQNFLKEMEKVSD